MISLLFIDIWVNVSAVKSSFIAESFMNINVNCLLDKAKINLNHKCFMIFHSARWNWIGIKKLFFISTQLPPTASNNHHFSSDLFRLIVIYAGNHPISIPLKYFNLKKIGLSCKFVLIKFTINWFQYSCLAFPGHRAWAH